MLRVVFVAGVRLYCEGLALILAGLDGIEVVGSSGHWQDAVPLVTDLRLTSC